MYFKFSDKVTRTSNVEKAHLWLYLNAPTGNHHHHLKTASNTSVWIHIYKVQKYPQLVLRSFHLQFFILLIANEGGFRPGRWIAGIEWGPAHPRSPGREGRLGVDWSAQSGGRLVPLARQQPRPGRSSRSLRKSAPKRQRPARQVAPLNTSQRSSPSRRINGKQFSFVFIHFHWCTNEMLREKTRPLLTFLFDFGPVPKEFRFVFAFTPRHRKEMAASLVKSNKCKQITTIRGIGHLYNVRSLRNRSDALWQKSLICTLSPFRNVSLAGLYRTRNSMN